MRKFICAALLALSFVAVESADAKVTYLGIGPVVDFPVRPIVVLPWGSVVVL